VKVKIKLLLLLVELQGRTELSSIPGITISPKQKGSLPLTTPPGDLFVDFF
jgi:hypothetical protein